MDTLLLNRKSCISSPRESIQKLSDKEANDKLLTHIANHLIINTSFLNNLGLYHGKMGIVLFFVHYSRYTGHSGYDDFAGELMDEIYEDLHAGISLDLENGLSGIGWGIIYLLKNRFMDGDPNDILKDIDRKLIELNLLQVNDLSVERGLAGYVYYLSERFSYDLVDSLFSDNYVNSYRQLILDRKIHENEFCLQSIKPGVSFSDLSKQSLGLQDGYAGYGLKLMQDDKKARLLIG